MYFRLREKERLREAEDVGQHRFRLVWYRRGLHGGPFEPRTVRKRLHLYILHYADSDVGRYHCSIYDIEKGTQKILKYT